MDLPGLLSDFASVTSPGADEQERDTFFSTLSCNQELQAALFAALSTNASNKDGTSLSKVLALLLHWSRRSSRDAAPHLVMQFLPCVLALSLTLRKTQVRHGAGVLVIEATSLLSLCLL